MAGLAQSPLLDMLNVQFVLVPIGLVTPVPIASWGNEVFRDGEVIVYENPNAYPRAWVVHLVRPVQDGAELEAFRSGTGSGRTVAFVDGGLPSVESGDGEDTATFKRMTVESMTFRTNSVTDGLLVVSDSYADGWNA